MIRDILVYLDNGEADEARLVYAEALAAEHDAFLTGLYCNIMPEMFISGDAGMSATPMIVDLQDQAMAAGDRFEQAMKARFDRISVPHAFQRMDLYGGQVGITLATAARTADLFVASRPFGDNNINPQYVESVLFEAGRACLLMPGTPAVPPCFDHVMIAWRNSREAGRAVSEAMPFLHKAKKVTLAMVTDDVPEPDEHVPGTNMARHLSRHDIDAELRHITGQGDAARALLDLTSSASADLLVMGGYGHSRLREMVLGGVTRDILKEAQLPILMAH